MVAKVVPILLLTIANVLGALGNYIPEKLPTEDNHDFAVSRKMYDATDLLRRMNNLASNERFDESDTSTKENYFVDRPYIGKRESLRLPWSDLIASLFNGDSSMIYRILQFSETASNWYQSSQHSQTPVGSLSSTGGLDVNLFDALYSISRYDDLKCIPRILCEVASGVTPGESIGYRRDSNRLGDIGKDILLRLLVNANFFGETSPLLSFGKAVILGYTSKDRPTNCYQEYPKCPRNPDRLIHYLNNHNGGFFRFFNKLGLGNNSHMRPPYVFQTKRIKSPSSRFGKIGFDRTDASKFKLDAAIPNDTWNSNGTVFSEERIRNQGSLNRVAFPNDVASAEVFDASNGFTKTLSNFEANDRINIKNVPTHLEDNTIFAFQKIREAEEKEEESNRLHTVHRYSKYSFRTFAFPSN